MRTALALATCAALAAAPAPGAQTFTLPCGLRCVLLEKHDQPFLRLELVVRWDPGARPGLSGMLAALLRAGGAGRHTRPEFNRALDDLGIAYEFQGRRNFFRWTLATDSRSQEPALGLLADAVFRPALDQPFLEGQRQLLARQRTEAGAADRGRARFLWSLGDEGVDLPPGRGFLDAVEVTELQAFWARSVRPENATLVLHGDLSLTQAKELVFLHFGLWGPALPTAAEPPAAPAPAEPRFLAVPLAGPDREFWAGRAATGVEPAVRELLDVLLEQQPRVLSAGIVSACSLGPGEPLLVKVKAGPEGREGLLAAFQETLAGLRRGFSAQDLERARTRWKARTAALPLHPRDQVRRLQEGVLDPDFQRKLEAVGLKELNAALERLLDPGGLKYLLLGGDLATAKEAEKAGLGAAVVVD